jgi:Na+-translocating ferredoxin:NAD+ oxidoreductase RnfG subunit
MSRALLAALVLATAFTARAQEGIFLSEAEAPRAVFPDADGFTRQDVESTPELRARLTERLGTIATSLWEERYLVFRAERAGATLGHAVIVEEIGKHRPITFVVGVRPDGSVADVAVVAYREAYGGEVRSQRFLSQYRDARAGADLRPYHEIKNVAGATLSVEAASRAVKKAQAVALEGER